MREDPLSLAQPVVWDPFAEARIGWCPNKSGESLRIGCSAAESVVILPLKCWCSYQRPEPIVKLQSVFGVWLKPASPVEHNGRRTPVPPASVLRDVSPPDGTEAREMQLLPEDPSWEGL